MGNKIFKNILFSSLLLIYIFIYVFFLLDKFLPYSESITASFCLFACFISILLFGYQKDKNKYLKKNILILSFIQIVIYFILIYGLGFIVGFLKNSYSLNGWMILSNIIYYVIMICAIEVTRYNVINSNKDYKFVIFIYTLLFMMLELMLSIRTYRFDSLYEIFRFLTISFIPLMVKHCVLSYLTFMVGYKPSLIYRLLIELYIYFIPILPDLGDYLTSIINIALPFLIFVYSSRMINEYENGVEHEFGKKTFSIIDIPFYVFFIILACLISGYFPYFMLGVGSASMEPAIKVGDAVIAHKIKDSKDIKEGDIVVYEHDGLSIVHRIILKTSKDGIDYFYTQGDGNRSSDDIELTMDDIRGKVVLKIPYIAKPTIYISNLLS